MHAVRDFRWVAVIVAASVVSLMGLARQANAINFGALLDTESALFTPANPPDDPENRSSASAFDSAAQDVIVDFSALSDTLVELTLSSSTGGFDVQFPEAGTLFFGFEGGAAFVNAGSFASSNVIVTFENFTGDPLPAPSASSVSMSGPGGDFFSVGALYDVPAGSMFSFDSVTLSFTASASLDTNFNTAAPTAVISGTIEPASNDHGQFVALADPAAPNAVPEPVGPDRSGRAWVHHTTTPRRINQH